MKRARLIAVGRLKEKHWQEAAAHYIKRLAPRLRLEELIIKDADASLPPERRKERESRRLLELLRPQDALLCLDEKGAALSSREFAAVLQKLHDSARVPCFAVGGAYGFAPEALEAASMTVAFGPMTFPHELAKVMLLEQIYRAEQILAGTGYHH